MNKERIIEDEKFESLPSKRIQPKIKPKPVEELPKIQQNTDVAIKVLPKRKLDLKEESPKIKKNTE